MTPEDYVARYHATCPPTEDALWIRPDQLDPTSSTPGLAARAAGLIARLRSSRTELDRCSSLPAEHVPTLLVSNAGVSLRASSDETAPGEAERCLLEALKAARLEETSPPAVALTFETVTPAPRAPTARTGLVEKGTVGRIIKAHSKKIGECYEAAMETWGKFEGRVLLRFEITAEGKTANVQILEDDTPVRPFACCIVAQVEAWGFPKPIGGGSAVIRFPLAFRIAPASKQSR